MIETENLRVCTPSPIQPEIGFACCDKRMGRLNAA